MKSIEDVISFAESKLGRPYIFGANGQLITKEFIIAKARQYPSMYTQSYIDKSMKWVKEPPVDGYDCSGLIDVALGVDYNAQGYYANATEKGKIVLYNDMPDIRGILVFKYSNTQGKMTHIGIYIGNGKVIEARGVDYGVVKTDRTSAWTHWGKCHLIDYGSGGVSTMIRLGSKGAEVSIWQTDLNKLGYGLVVDGDFGSATLAATKAFQMKYNLEADGIVGDMTYAKMAEVLTPVPTPPTVDYKALCEQKDIKISELANANIALIALNDKYFALLSDVGRAMDTLDKIRTEF